MLAEYLEPEAGWEDIMPGVRICRFSREQGGGALSAQLPIRLETLHFEALFCLRGRVILARRDGTALAAGGREVLLLTDISDLESARIDGGAAGILVAVDARGARKSLDTLCGLLGGLALDTGRVREWMARRRGCAAIGGTAWSRGVFEQLERLPAAEQGRYCAWKSVELLYLLSAPEERGQAEEPASQPGRELACAAAEIRHYMEAHLSEPLTIPELSRHFYLSPTAFKAAFRRMYGCPVHAWLRQRRMERAAELLRASGLSVLGVAQAVGYSSASQFTAAFRQHYGVAPGQYRKMSEPAELRPFR